MSPIDLSPWFYVIGWMLIHFVWQAIFVGVGLWLLLQLVPQNWSPLRYRISVAALIAICLCPVLTSIHLTQGQSTPQEAPTPIVAQTPSSTMPELVSSEAPAPVETVNIETSISQHSDSDVIAPYLPWLVIVWCVGMVITNTRLIQSWFVLHRWKKMGMLLPTSGTSVSIFWQSDFRFGTIRNCWSRRRSMCQWSLAGSNQSSWFPPDS